MIISGCLGLGLWYRSQFIGRLRALRALAGMLELFASEIRYGKSTLPECCGALAGRVGEPYRRCLLEICRRMREQSGASFRRVFHEEMGSCLESLPLQEEERQIFLGVFDGEGFQDGQMQLRGLEQGARRLSRIIEGQEREQGGKCRMAVGLGAMGGLLLILVLI